MGARSTTTLFTEKSDDYAKFRPGYPDKVVDIILQPYKHQSNIQVIDVGAGTGIASRLMADEGASVLGVEPNKSMIASALAYQGVSYIQSTAEDIPVEDNHADVVTSFQAFHWFNFKKSLWEFNRVLKPSGRLGIVWSFWDQRDPFTRAYATLIDDATKKNPDRVSPYDGFPSGKWKRLRIRILWKFKRLPYFRNVQRYKLQHTEEVNLETLIGCARSQSYIDHTGPLWAELVRDIETLCKSEPSLALVHTINVFTAEAIKKQ